MRMKRIGTELQGAKCDRAGLASGVQQCMWRQCGGCHVVRCCSKACAAPECRAACERSGAASAAEAVLHAVPAPVGLEQGGDAGVARAGHAPLIDMAALSDCCKRQTAGSCCTAALGSSDCMGEVHEEGQQLAAAARLSTPDKNSERCPITHSSDAVESQEGAAIRHAKGHPPATACGAGCSCRQARRGTGSTSGPRARRHCLFQSRQSLASSHVSAHRF
jgi:hypothetical protein